MFVGYAKALALDENKFRTDMLSDAVTQKINYDIALGKKAGVQGTPTIYVNGELVSDMRVKDGKIAPSSDTESPFVWSSVEDFGKLVIEPALEKADSATK